MSSFKRLCIIALLSYLSQSVSAVTTVVSTSDQLEAALAAGATDIQMTGGTYNAPADGTGFKVRKTNTKISAAPSATVIVTCGGNSDPRTFGPLGFNVTAYNAAMNRITVEQCGTAIHTSSILSNYYDMVIRDNINNVGVGAAFHTLVDSYTNIYRANIYGNTGNTILAYWVTRIYNSDIHDNVGTGLTARYSTNTRVEASTIRNNQGGGIFLTEDSYVIVKDSEISGNTVANKDPVFGGGIGAFNSKIVVDNSKIINNQADQNGGGIYSVVNKPGYNGGYLTIKAGSEVDGNTVQSEPNNIVFSGIVTSISSTKLSSNTGSITKYCCNGSRKSTFTSETCSYPPPSSCV